MANTKKYVSLDKLSLYDEKIKGVITAGDAAALDSAKAYADGLAVNYDAAGSANTALESAKAYADGKDTAIADAKKAGTDAAAAAATADGKAVAAQTAADNAQTAVDDLADYVGDIPTGEAYADVSTVIGYVNKKAEETLAAAQGGSSETAASVKQQLDNYKSENNTKVDKNTEDIAALQTALDEEVERADAAEKANAAAIKVISDDYLKAADKEELQGNIDTVSGAVERLTNGVSAEEIDGVNDLIQYVKDHGTEVTGMQEDISDNADAIAGVAGRMDTAEDKITAVEGAVATKAEKTYVDEQVQALQGVDTGLDNRLKVVEAAVGESGSVADDIATAKQEAIDAAAADATTKAGNAETAAKTYADGLNTSMNTRVEALEAIDHDHSNKAELDLIVSGDKAKWDEAYTKRHEHSNLAVLEGITSAKVTAWDAAEGNAKTYADGLNTAMDTRVAALETWHTNFTECSEDEINALFQA